MVASAALVMALGILSTTQTDLAKALERQGIETWDLIRAGLRGGAKGIEDKIRKPLIYAVGLALIMTGFVLLRGIRPRVTATSPSDFPLGLAGNGGSRPAHG